MNTPLATSKPFYRRRLVILAAVMGAIVGSCGFVSLRPTTFQGVALPSILIYDFPHPPAAWLIVDNQAIPATFGDYCWHHLFWGGECITAARAEAIPDLATVTLPPNHAPTIVVNMSGPLVFLPTVRPWNSIVAPEARRLLEGTSSLAGRFSTFTLQPLSQVEDQVLEVEVMPSGTKRATYLWHLNP